MSNRERWTVYPLIFLTLGIAVKDKVTRLVQTDSVVCRELKVTDRQGRPQVIVAPNMVVCHELLVTDRQGKPQVIVGSNASGGVVQLIPAGAAVPPGQPRIMPDQPEQDSERPSERWHPDESAPHPPQQRQSEGPAERAPDDEK